MFDRLVEKFLEFLDLFRFFEVVNEYEVAVLLRFGAFWKVLEPGRIHFRAPFGIDSVLTDIGVPTAYNLPEQVVTLRCGATICVTPVVTTRINDVQRYFLDVENPESALADAAGGTIRQVLTGMDYAEARSEYVTEALTKAVRKSAWRWGMEVMSVQLSDLAKVRAYRIYGSAA